MPISLTAMAKHGRAAILHLPVFCRVPAIPADEEGGPQAAEAIFPASFEHSAGSLDAIDGGIVYERGGALLISKSDLPATVIEQTPLEMLTLGTATLVMGVYIVSAGPEEWTTYNVEGVTGRENPTATEVRVAIGPNNN